MTRRPRETHRAAPTPWEKRTATGPRSSRQRARDDRRGSARAIAGKQSRRSRLNGTARCAQVERSYRAAGLLPTPSRPRIAERRSWRVGRSQRRRRRMPPISWSRVPVSTGQSAKRKSAHAPTADIATCARSPKQWRAGGAPEVKSDRERGGAGSPGLAIPSALRLGAA